MTSRRTSPHPLSATQVIILMGGGEGVRAGAEPCGESPPPKLETLRRRADFLAANGGARVARPGFVLLVRRDASPAIRFGITVSKRVGNAVVRNRMKRRFRALLRELLPKAGVAGADHVLIGREAGIERPFALLRDELAGALARAAAGKGDRPRPPRKSKR